MLHVTIQSLHSDIAVYLDSWIGTVRDMRYRISLRFNDKSHCTVDSYGIAEHFEDTRRSSDGFGNGETFYPGQRLRGPMRYLRNADWGHCSEDLKRAKDRKLVTVIVTCVETTGVSVQWQWQTPTSEKEIFKDSGKLEEIPSTAQTTADDKVAPTPSGDERPTPPIEEKKPEKESIKKQPPDLVTGEDLKRIRSLNLFDACTVQLGDISFYTPSPNDTLLNKKVWRRESNIRILNSHDLADKASDSKLDDENDSEIENDDAQASVENDSGNENETAEINIKIEPVRTENSVVRQLYTLHNLVCCIVFSYDFILF